MNVELIQADVSKPLPLETASVQSIVTSPPYYGLRDYGVEPSIWDEVFKECEHHWIPDKKFVPRRASETNSAKQLSNRGTAMDDSVMAVREHCSICGAWKGCLGHEPHVGMYARHLAQIFQELKRVLRPDGVLLLNIGDSYFKGNLLGVPWKVAFAMQNDGWILRTDLVWEKGNVMPESVKSRPTRSHEMIFMFTKRNKYFWNNEAIRERSVSTHGSGNGYKRPERLSYKDEAGIRGSDNTWEMTEYRNARTVLHINTKPIKGVEHFATMPLELARWCVLASSRPGDVVLDPFVGSGTTGVTCVQEGRRFVGVDISEEYIELAQRRIEGEQHYNGRT